MSGSGPGTDRRGDPGAFVTAHAQLTRPPLVPELLLHLATEVTPLWEATEAWLDARGLPPPYWAFAWPGGQALARFLLDHPSRVAGRRVLDFGSGSGIAGLAAARAGAASVTACDVDAFALAAIGLNARANGLPVEIRAEDPLDGTPAGIDLVLCGDVCYEQPMAGRLTAWLQRLAGAGVAVLLADPGRRYLPVSGLVEEARYAVPTSMDLEDATVRHTIVWRLAPESEARDLSSGLSAGPAA